MARRKSLPPASDDYLNLRLLQNAFVRGEFTPAGTVMQFPKVEARRRLSRTRYWVLA